MGHLLRRVVHDQVFVNETVYKFIRFENPHLKLAEHGGGIAQFKTFIASKRWLLILGTSK
jgi:hypothetical protein